MTTKRVDVTTKRVVGRSWGSALSDGTSDSETGVYMPPAGPVALRRAIQRLLDSPAEADCMGRAGPLWSSRSLTASADKAHDSQPIRAPGTGRPGSIHHNRGDLTLTLAAR